MSPVELGIGAGIGALLLGGGLWILRRALNKAEDAAVRTEREADLERANEELEQRSRPLDPRTLVQRLRDAISRSR